jgi:hypothetical protein
VARYSGWLGDCLLQSLLNGRSSKPQRHLEFTCGFSYPEPGVLRQTVSGMSVHTWCDRVISIDWARINVWLRHEIEGRFQNAPTAATGRLGTSAMSEGRNFRKLSRSKEAARVNF